MKMETPRMSASKDLLNSSQLASLTQGWGLATKASSGSSTVTSAVSPRNWAKSGQVSLLEKGPKEPPPPKFSLTSSHGNVTHLFSIDPDIIKHLSSQINNADRSILVGSVSTKGWLVIWDLNSRRSVLEEDSGLENCSWASIVPDQDNLIIFIHSRTEGLFKFNGFPLQNPSNYHSSTRQVAVHPGFCKPDIFDGSKFLAYPCVGNKSPENYCKVLQFDFQEEATFPPVEPVVFVMAISFPGGNQSVLCGCETGTVILFDVRSARPVGSTNIHEHNASKNDKDEIPFCCDYDPINSSILIGSSHRNLYSFEVPSFQLAKRIVVTNPGTTCVSIRQDGQLAATGGTDSAVRIFSWPDLKALAVLKFHCDVLSTLRFLHTSEGLLLLSCSQDSVLAVWDIYSKVKRLEK